MSFNFLSLFGAFAGYVLAHIVFLHVIGASHFIRNAALLGMPVILGPWFSSLEKVLFVTIWNMYVFALICSVNSVSLRILEELAQAPNGRLSQSTLLEKFSDEESLSARVDLMQKNSFLRKIGDHHVRIERKGSWVARGILFGRRIFSVSNPG